MNEGRLPTNREPSIIIHKSGKATCLPGTPCNKYPRRNGIPIRSLERDDVVDSVFLPLSAYLGRTRLNHHAMFRFNRTHQSSERKKSLQSARSISFTAGSSTIELIGRFWRAPFHLQQPYVLQVGRSVRDQKIPLRR